jgi:hypothetical protein
VQVVPVLESGVRSDLSSVKASDIDRLVLYRSPSSRYKHDLGTGS